MGSGWAQGFSAQIFEHIIPMWMNLGRRSFKICYIAIMFTPKQQLCHRSWDVTVLQVLTDNCDEAYEGIEKVTPADFAVSQDINQQFASRPHSHPFPKTLASASSVTVTTTSNITSMQ